MPMGLQRIPKRHFRGITFQIKIIENKSLGKTLGAICAKITEQKIAKNLWKS